MVYFKNYFNDMDNVALAKSEVFSNFVGIVAKNDALQKTADDAEIQKLLDVLSLKIKHNEQYRQKLIDLKRQLSEDPGAAAAQGLTPDFVSALNMLELGFEG